MSACGGGPVTVRLKPYTTQVDALTAGEHADVEKTYIGSVCPWLCGLSRETGAARSSPLAPTTGSMNA